MVLLRSLGVFLLALCAFSGAFLLAYAAILCGWIVYADYSGALGGADGSASIVAFRWAPLGGLAAGLLCAASLFRLGRRSKLPRNPVATAVVEPQLSQADPSENDLDRRLAEHGALLQQLQALARQQSVEAPEPAADKVKNVSNFPEQPKRRVA